MGKAAFFLPVALFTIMVAATMLSPFAPAFAQTSLGKDAANDYYRQCMATDDPRMNDESQESLCSCTAAAMMQVLSEEDLAILSPLPGPGREAYDTMLADAYAPCMQVPIEEQLYGECMEDSKIREFRLDDTAGLCACMARETTRDFSEIAPYLMRLALKTRPDLQDAFEALHSNAHFRMQAHENLLACLHND